MNIISWNCRGLKNSLKVEAVKELLRMASLVILLLQETKIEEDYLLSLSNKYWKMNVGKDVSARGNASGIATLWTENAFSMEHSHTSQHWILSELRHTPSKKSLALFNLYVPVNFQEKRDCWNSLVAFLAANSFSNIIMASDLNIIMNAKEKKGGVCGRGPMLYTVQNLILY